MSTYCLQVYGDKSSLNLIEDPFYINLSLIFLLYRSFIFGFWQKKIFFIIMWLDVDLWVYRAWSWIAFVHYFFKYIFLLFLNLFLFWYSHYAYVWSIIWYPTSLSDFVHFSSFFSLSVLWFYYFNCPYLQLILSPICSNLCWSPSVNFSFSYFTLQLQNFYSFNK